MSFVNDLQKENEANGTNNYADFIKGLIINDFKAMQNEIVESIKREQGGSGKKVKAQTPMSSAIALILSVICFVFLLIFYTFIFIKFYFFTYLTIYF